MALPQANATLTSVSGTDFLEDYDRAEADAQRWQGRADAYYQEKRRWVGGAGGQDHVLSRSLIVDESVAGAVRFAVGDVLGFEFGGAALTGKVDDVERRTLPGHPLQTTKLTLREVEES